MISTETKTKKRADVDTRISQLEDELRKLKLKKAKEEREAKERKRREITDLLLDAGIDKFEVSMIKEKIPEIMRLFDSPRTIVERQSVAETA